MVEGTEARVLGSVGQGPVCVAPGAYGRGDPDCGEGREGCVKTSQDKGRSTILPDGEIIESPLGS